MIYKKFEEIEVWQKSRKFVNNIYDLLTKNRMRSKDYVLADQLKRASYSVMLNIAEGFERGSNKEFANFLNIAKGSAGEVRSVFHIMLDQQYIDHTTHGKLIESIEGISVQLATFRKFLLKNNVK